MDIDMTTSSSSFEGRAHALLDRFLPPVCTRPNTLLSLPAAILANTLCLRASLSLAIGFAVVFFAGIIKVPQIATIVSNKSVTGLSAITFLIETFGYTYNLAAHYRQSYPISTYGDFYILLVQNYVILYLFYKYTNRTSLGLAIIVVFIATLFFMCTPYFPLELIRFLILGNVAVVVLGRTPQIYANHVNGSTGALSIITCWGIFLGALARIFTTLQDVDSFNILAGYLGSAVLNGIIAFQVLYFRYLKPKGMPESKVKKSA